MNKKELSRKIYEHLEGKITVKEANNIVELSLDAIGDALKNGEEVMLQSFGKFYVSEHGARKGRNPQTGEELQIPPHRRPQFKASGKLKERVQ